MNEIYRAPNSDLGANNKNTTIKRPKVIWVICALYSVPFSFLIYKIYKNNFESIPFNRAIKMFFALNEPQELLSIAIILLVMAVSIITLFMLKKTTVMAWGAQVIIAIINFIIVSNSTQNSAKMFGAISACLIASGVFIYTVHLIKKGRLN